jgi:hypothetical protein
MRHGSHLRELALPIPLLDKGIVMTARLTPGHRRCSRLRAWENAPRHHESLSRAPNGLTLP